MRARVVALALLLAGAALVTGATPARAQAVSARFEITGVGDSTFAFAVGRERWVLKKGRGMVVDPANRDRLVARFNVVGLSQGMATALVTGQTTRVTMQHVVLMEPPPPPRWFRRGSFWGGMTLGAVLGVVAGTAL